MSKPFWEKHDTFTVLCHGACALVTLLLSIGSWYATPLLFDAWRQTLDERMAVVEALIEQKPNISAQHDAAAEKCAAAEAALALVKRRVPAKLDTSEFYRLVSREAVAQKVELGDVRPQDHRAMGVLNRHRWRMSARGDFLDVCKFIQAVERLPIQCFVDSIVVNGGASDGQTMIADLSIVGFSQRIETPKPEPKPATP